MKIYTQLALLSFLLSACRILPVSETQIQTAKAIETDSGPQTSTTEAEKIQGSSDIDVIANEPVSIAGAYLTCAKRTFDTNLSYACTVFDADAKKRSVKAEDVESLSVLAGAEMLEPLIVWHEERDPTSFSFEDLPTRGIDLIVQLKLKNIPMMQSTTTMYQSMQATSKVLYANGFENFALDTANQANNNNSWFFSVFPGWTVDWTQSQSGVAVCSQTPVIEIQTENAGNGVTQAQPKSYKGLYHLELDSGCMTTIPSTTETDVKIARVLDVTVGHWYSLEFFYMSRSGSSNPRFVVQIDKKNVFDETQAKLPTTWAPFRYVFKATRPTVTLSLADMGSGTDLNRGILIDELVISALD